MSYCLLPPAQDRCGTRPYLSQLVTCPLIPLHTMPHFFSQNEGHILHPMWILQLKTWLLHGSNTQRPPALWRYRKCYYAIVYMIPITLTCKSELGVIPGLVQFQTNHSSIFYPPIMLGYTLDLKWSGLSLSLLKIHLAGTVTFHQEVEGCLVFSHPTTKDSLGAQ